MCFVLMYSACALDISLGISYTVDSDTGTCSVAHIGYSPLTSVKVKNSNDVRIKLAQEWFHLDDKTYTYTGKVMFSVVDD